MSLKETFRPCEQWPAGLSLHDGWGRDQQPGIGVDIRQLEEHGEEEGEEQNYSKIDYGLLKHRGQLMD